MQHALVTGASRGIGRATAVALSARGDRVAVHFGSDRAAAEVTMESLHGEGHLLVGGDLSSSATARRVVDDVLEAFDRIDVLVNNAAVAPSPSNRHPVDSTDYEQWQRAWRDMVDVDLHGPANVSFLVANSLIARGLPGAIVNVGSRGAFRGEPEFPAYAAAKAGLHALGQSLAVALAPHGIAVTTVAPGFIATERQSDRLAGPDGDGLREQSPFGRVGTADEVAAAIVYLTSPEARWSSGAILDINGASYLR